MQTRTATAAAPERDLPVPAPASRQRLRPTADPVLRDDQWFAHRRADMIGAWHVCLFDSRGTPPIEWQQTCVTDDFGSLVAISDGMDSANAIFWHSGFGIDQAADDWILEQLHDAGHYHREAQRAQRTRDLLRPPPVTVEIVTEPAHEVCAASIVIGADPRIDAPLYSLHIDRELPILLSHAQLCALLLGAQQLVKASTPRGRLS